MAGRHAKPESERRSTNRRVPTYPTADEVELLDRLRGDESRNGFIWRLVREAGEQETGA